MIRYSRAGKQSGDLVPEPVEEFRFRSEEAGRKAARDKRTTKDKSAGRKSAARHRL